MPGFDGTGPDGRGPMTGGGFGYCDEKTPRSEMTPRGSRPIRMGRGRRGGLRNGRRSR